MKYDLRFLEPQVLRITDAIAEAALDLCGTPYGPVNTARRIGDGHWVGTVNCYGVLLLAAREAGLLPEDFDVNLPPAQFGQPVAKSILQILQTNFDEVDKETAEGNCALRPADVLLLRWRDVNPHLTEPHHVALYLSHCAPHGTMLHALDSQSGGGNVFVQRISELDWRRIDSVWRLKGAWPRG